MRSKFFDRKYLKEYLWRLTLLDCTLSENLINSERWAGQPWVADYVRLPDSDVIVGIYYLEETLYAYELYSRYNRTTAGSISLTAQDIIDLYSTANTEKQIEFDKLVSWWETDYGIGVGIEKVYAYSCFSDIVYEHYQDLYGESYFDKELRMCNATERYEVVQWGLENIDYKFTAALIESESVRPCGTPEEEYPDDTPETGYLKFLEEIGILARDDDGNLYIKDAE